MLDGLEVVELKLSELLEDNKSFRFDSEYFKKEYLSLQKQIYNYPYKKFGYFSKMTSKKYERMTFQKDGVKYLTAENIQKGFVDISTIKYISKEADEKNKKTSIKVGDILISITGILGEVAIAEPWLLPANINRDIAIITNHKKEEYLSEYIVLFLMSKIGNKFFERLGSGGIQKIITLERLRTLMIPVLSNKFQHKVSSFYSLSQKKRIKSKTLYKESENLLLKALNLLDFEPTKENISIKSFSESFGESGRLDSEFYQVKYDDLEQLIIQNSIKKTKIIDEFEHIKTKFDKSKTGYNYIEIGNVNVFDGTNNSTYIITKNLSTNAKIKVKKGDLLISTTIPTRKAITIINGDDTDLVVSSEFTVLRKKPNSQVNTQVLQVLLRTDIYKEFFLKYNVGTKYPIIKNEDVLNITIPIINNTIQRKIEEKIKESFKLQEESKELLELAKKSIEVAVEEGESVGMELMGDNSDD